jgi:hypothetical protein
LLLNSFYVSLSKTHLFPSLIHLFFLSPSSGILALIQSIVNQATIGPIVFFVGLQVCEEALAFMPQRHYSAFIIGLFPSIYDWVTNVANRSPLTDDFTYDTNSPGTSGWVGVLAWKRGALLVSMLWVAILVNVIDRQWKSASIWAIVASFFALFGIIHMPEAGVKNLDQSPWEHCFSPDYCWEFSLQWMYVVAYVMMAATFCIILFASKYDSQIQDPIDDETRHAFDDWFKDAAKVTDSHGNVIEDPTVEKKLDDDDDGPVKDSEEEIPSAPSEEEE